MEGSFISLPFWHGWHTGSSCYLEILRGLIKYVKAAYIEDTCISTYTHTLMVSHHRSVTRSTFTSAPSVCHKAVKYRYELLQSPTFVDKSTLILFRADPEFALSQLEPYKAA